MQVGADKCRSLQLSKPSSPWPVRPKPMKNAWPVSKIFGLRTPSVSGQNAAHSGREALRKSGVHQRE